MAIRIKTPQGPEPMPELAALLKDKTFSIDGDAVMCPHCIRYIEKFKGNSGPHKCPLCGQTFYLLRRGRWSFLTSKTELTSGEMHP